MLRTPSATIPAESEVVFKTSDHSYDFDLVLPVTGYSNTVLNAGYSTIGFHITIPTGSSVLFEGTFDGANWTAVTFRQMGDDGYAQETGSSLSADDANYIGSISSLRAIRFKTLATAAAPGRVCGRLSTAVSTLEGVEHGNPPHKVGYAPVKKPFSFAGGATDFVIWQPQTGYKFVLTDLIFSVSEGTCTVTVFDGANSTSNIIFKGDAKPANAQSQLVTLNFSMPQISAASNNALKITTTDSPTVTGIALGYEVNS